VLDQYKGKFQKNTELKFLISQESGGDIAKFKGKSAIVAFNTTSWRPPSGPLRSSNLLPVKNFCFPLADSGQTLEWLKSQIQNTLTLEDAKLSFERFLQARWPASLINEFCRNDRQLNPIGPSVDLRDKGPEGTWSGFLLKDSKEISGKTLEYSAILCDGEPTLYSINVLASNGTWNLEMRSPSLKARHWSRNDYLIHLVSRSIEAPLFSDFCANGQGNPAIKQRWVNFSLRKDERIKKLQGGRVQYSCTLPHCVSLSVTTDENLKITKIFVGNKESRAWLQTYQSMDENQKKSLLKIRTQPQPQ
jgi:hypothetical protein